MVNIGIIGCGSITRTRHAPEYAANPGSQIVGFYNPTKSRAAELAEKYGGQVFDSYNELLTDKTIDAVSICTPNSTHVSIAVAAFKAGKHVLCEKPVAVSIEETQEMISAAGKAGRYLMVAYNQRFAPAHVKARKILQSGELGKVISFRTAFTHRGPEFWSAAKSTNTWFFRKDDAAVGALLDLGTHKIDLIRWLIEDEVGEVTAAVMTLDKKYPNGEPIGVDDNALCILKTKKGIAGTLSVGWTNYSGMVPDNGTIIFCAEGIMKIYDDTDHPLQIFRRNGEKAFYRFTQNTVSPAMENSGVVDEFIRCIVNGIKPECSGEEGLTALKVVLACLESSEKGKKIVL